MPDEPSKNDDAMLLAQRAKLQAETAKLEAERAKLSAELKRPWLLRLMLPAVVVAFGTGLGGLAFGDSLVDRNRAEIRREVLKQYFAVDNELAGKRKQILSFVQKFLATDDAALADWCGTEMKIVEAQLKDLRAELDRLEVELRELQAKADSLDAESDEEDATENAAATAKLNKLASRTIQSNITEAQEKLAANKKLTQKKVQKKLATRLSTEKLVVDKKERRDVLLRSIDARRLKAVSQQVRTQ